MGSSSTDSIKKNIEEFQVSLDKYYKCLIEFYWDTNKNYSEYSIAHPQLVEESIKLQAGYIKLPDDLQVRLLEIDIEVFLHCNNVVDMYSFREYLYENKKHYALATLIERIDAELKLASLIASQDSWDRYNKLPRINLDFYREEKHVSMLEERLNEEDINYIAEDNSKIKIEREPNNFQDINNWINKIENINESSSKSILDKYSKLIEKSDVATEKTINFVGKITPVLKFLWNFISKN